MTTALLAAILFSTATLGASKPSVEVGAHGRAGVQEYLTAATALTLQNELDHAQRAVDKGRAKFPGAHGFHLKQGDIHKARGKLAEAYYEWQWEQWRAGAFETGLAAGNKIAELAKSDARGPEMDEIGTVLSAMARMPADGAGALADLRRVQKDRGDRFALAVLIAGAQVQAKDVAGAEGDYRALLARDPHFVPAMVELAGVLRLLGKHDEAAKLDAKAKTVDPNHPSVFPLAK